MLTIVTGNPRKFEKIVTFLPHDLEVRQKDIEIDEIQSGNVDVVSAHKALKAFQFLGVSLLVEDTAVYFDEYEGFPGPFAKFAYQSLGRKGMQRLLQQAKNKQIRFRSVVSYMDETLDEPVSFGGESIGMANFDFPDVPVDPYVPYRNFFQPLGADTIAALSDNHFGESHHRVKAVKKFVERYEKR